MSAWIAQHLAALRDALRRLAAAPLNTALSLLVIGIALTLPSAGWVALENLRTVAGGSSNSQQISIFLTLDAGKRDVGEIETRLRAAGAGSWHFVAKEDALKRLQATEGMAEIVASLPRNPLPDAFVVEPGDIRPEALEALAKTFAGWPKVAHVQLDSAWIKRFDAFLRIARLAMTLLAGLFAAALVAVTFNTIRLQILAQAAEIEVARLIGATDAFIRRPFQYFGTDVRRHAEGCYLWFPEVFAFNLHSRTLVGYIDPYSRVSLSRTGSYLRRKRERYKKAACLQQYRKYRDHFHRNWPVPDI